MTLLTSVAVGIVAMFVFVVVCKMHSRLFVSRKLHGAAVEHIGGLQRRIESQPETVEPVDEDAVVLEALQKLSGMLHQNAQFGLRFLSDMGLPQGQGVVGFLTAYVGSLPKQQQSNGNSNGNGKPKNKPKQQPKPEPKVEDYRIPVR
tara:strand:- start:77 stop:517 length:441 start_codon:yes stop_codon:yes gene_type:complete